MAKHITLSGLVAIIVWSLVVVFFSFQQTTKYENAILRLEKSRFSFILNDLITEIETSLDRGTTLLALDNGQIIVDQRSSSEEDISLLFIYDKLREKILFSSSAEISGDEFKTDRLEKIWFELKDGKGKAGHIIENALGEAVGGVVLEYDRSYVIDALAQLNSKILWWILPIYFLGIFCVFIACFAAFCLFKGKEFNFVFKKKEFSAFWTGISLSLLAFLLFVSALSQAISSDNAKLEKSLAKPIEKKGQSVALVLVDVVNRAITQGIPLGYLRGVDDFLNFVKKENSEVSYILLTDDVGRILFEQGKAGDAFKKNDKTGKVSLVPYFHNITEPIERLGRNIGWVQIGISERYLRGKK